MKWRRGLMFGAIHMALAVPVVVQQQMWDKRPSTAMIVVLAPSHAERLALQESQTTSFDPCNGGFVDFYPPPQQMAIAAGNLPVAEALGWPNPCRGHSGVERFAARLFGANSRGAGAAVLAILISAILVEWLLIGGFPPIRGKWWWQEPGVFITIFTSLAVVLALIPSSWAGIAYPFAFAILAAVVGWLAWFVLLVWKAAMASWR